MKSTIATLLAGTLVATASAQDLFVFELSETGNQSNMLTVGGNSLPDLANDFADLEGDFTSFNGTSFSASLDYAGVADAIRFTYDPMGGAGGGELLVIDSLAGYDGSITFDEAEGDLGDQLEDFFLKDNPDALSDFLSEMAKESFAAVTDGNPLAATARSARYKYDRFGLNADLTPTEMDLFNRFTVRDRAAAAGRETPDVGIEQGGPATDPGPDFPAHEADGPWRFRMNVTASHVEAGDFDGYSLDGYFTSEVLFNEHVSLALGGQLAYHDLEGANIFNGAFHLDLPIRIINPEPNEKVRWTWQVTPGAAAGWTASYDLAAGGAMYTLGAANRFTVDLPRGWSLTAAQSFTFHEGQKLEIDDYEFDPGVSQQILKLGGKVTKRVGDKAMLFGGATWTDFLEDAAVDNYVTPTAGVGFMFRNGGTVTIAYEGDFADDFTRHGARVDVSFPF